MSPPRQLILLPGLGADRRLFDRQRPWFPDLMVPDWIPPRPRERLTDYAARMAETIRWPSATRVVLGGVSFGGMAAYEIARHLKPDAVVLIASCRRRRGLRLVHRGGTWLLPAMPTSVWDFAKRIAGPMSRWTGETAPAERAKLIQMFREQDSRFMQWTLEAILHWHPAPLEGIPVFQIHGRRDWLLPAWRADADEWVPDGGHLINVTHAEKVNAFLRRVMERPEGMRDEG